MIKLTLVCGVFTVIGLTVLQFHAQGVWKSESQEILNLSTAPAKIEINRNGKYMRLKNLSSKRITDFRFGCISKRGKTLEMVTDFAPQIAYFHENRIESEHSLIFGIETSGITNCSIENEQLLTIALLKFDDKSQWEFTEHIKSEVKPGGN